MFENFKKGDIIAFKSKKAGSEGWFAGEITHINCDSIRIDIFLPVSPQWGEDGDFTTAYKDDISEHLVLLERQS